MQLENDFIMERREVFFKNNREVNIRSWVNKAYFLKWLTNADWAIFSSAPVVMFFTVT